MRVSLGQLRDIHVSDLTFAKQLGVAGVSYNSLDFSSQAVKPHMNRPLWGYDDDPFWRYEDLVRLRELVEQHGLALEALENLPRHMTVDIRTNGPDRDRQIDNFCITLENMGRAGIPILGYNFMVMTVQRTSNTAPGRGGAHCTAFNLADLPTDELAFGRRIEAEEVWERYEYFISRVLPVAESAKVKLALHPDDPPVPELYGVACIFHDLAGHRRAIETIAPSPYHGLDFCCGTWASAGVDSMYEALAHFATSQKIFYVHFRNVIGTVPNFREGFVDEAGYDVVRALTILRDSKFDGFIMDDHVPGMISDTAWGYRERCYATGYIKGLLRALVA